ncbi:UDP-glycosyltransferase 87A1-like isoform X2 [Pistacia vera]|uniref:UDP-glycosyltransferase 87A1-like isoform X2 n=1 Tax=Pistacia vera TaxID=55513 RepID=UPI00126386AA|nr:UDP-glycosyltransferase 87A1-like isoform X2 [Pistacia vera]
MEAPFEKLLDEVEFETPGTAIIADSYMPWAVDVGNRRNIPVASLWPMSASELSVYHHIDLLVKNGHFPVELPASRAWRRESGLHPRTSFNKGS